MTALFNTSFKGCQEKTLSWFRLSPARLTGENVAGTCEILRPDVLGRVCLKPQRNQLISEGLYFLTVALRLSEE